MHNFLKNYLSNRLSHNEWVRDAMNQECKLCIVIPCYNENGLKSCLDSIVEQDFPSKYYEIVVVVNSLKDSPKEERELFDLAIQDCNSYSNVHALNLIFETKKDSGVGWARKEGMDFALKRFVDINNLDGLIVCLDADCTVENNYLQALFAFQQGNRLSPGASIYYEHPLDYIGNAIYQYELHLRYYVEKQRQLGLPYAFQTVGSSMAVRAWAYAKEGGMNKRKAGEDFYFIHKYTLDKNFTEINSTTVFPSARSSERVPFGTGRAILNFKDEILTYHPKNFELLATFLDRIPQIYKIRECTNQSLISIGIPDEVLKFLALQNRIQELCVVKSSIKDFVGFKKRFFQWFDAFQLMKFLHFARQEYYEDMPILKIANNEAIKLGKQEDADLLEFFRVRGRAGQWRDGVIFC